MRMLQCVNGFGTAYALAKHRCFSALKPTAAKNSIVASDYGNCFRSVPVLYTLGSLQTTRSAAFQTPSEGEPRYI
jgi:hypothetical protein